ncbi:hypothetical protein [Sphingomonas sp. LHG3443-2]|uniref:hypothetical protein n=1 Tax=Sphingomonas sp. LHG3443-2 TaxID=2804639 RepID=UPI003CED4BC1
MMKLAVTVAFLMASTAAAAQASPDEQAIQAYAEEFGISTSEAARRVALQDKVNTLYNQLLSNPQFSGLRSYRTGSPIELWPE